MSIAEIANGSQATDPTGLVAKLDAERAARVAAENERRLLDEFISTLSHEVRTPLNAMYGWAQLLAEMEIDADVRRGIEAILRNARLQMKLINDLLDLKRIVSGRIVLNRERLDIVALVASVAESVRPLSLDKELRLVVSHPDAPAAVVVDRARIEQVIFNLLSNAVKFTPRGGRIDLSIDVADDDVRVVVLDTGIGIESGLLPRIFERFHQGEHETTKRHAGLGIGLAVVRRLVELHGGQVAAFSAGIGSGARFVVTLPRPASRSLRTWSDDAPVDEAHDELAGARILVVEDEEDARDLLVCLLERHGAEVTAATTVADALTALARAEFDLLLSSLGLPDETGLALVRRLRSWSSPNASIPAIALTAYARRRDREACRDAGFDRHVAKPFEAPDLLGTLRDALARVRHGRIAPAMTRDES